MEDKRMTFEEIKEFLPWAVGLVSTIIALKKDWIKDKLSQKMDEEDVEAKALQNVEKTVQIYQRMLDDMESRFSTQMESLNLKVEALERRNEELDLLVEEQKELIKKQSRSLDYYRRKCDQCPVPPEQKDAA